MPMDSSPDPNRELILLEQIEQDPDVTQATLASKLGVAVGTVNWHLKRFVSKGYVKVKRAQRRKLRYIITPEGLAFRAKLTVSYVDQSMRLYRRTREHVKDLLMEVKRGGYEKAMIQGDGDIAEICRLSCLEHGVLVVENDEVPILAVKGYKVILQMDGVSAAESIDGSTGQDL